MRRKSIIIILCIVVFLVALRIALPHILLKYVNKKLANLDKYYGHVEDIDLALIRGAYAINNIKIMKIADDEKKDTVPFFSSSAIDMSVEWRAIFKGKVVAEIYVQDPVLTFVKEKVKKEIKDTTDFRRVIKDLMPLKINYFEITNGRIHYIDPSSNPKVDVSIKDLHVIVTDLSNKPEGDKLLPSHLDATGKAYGGEFSMRLNFDALNKTPTFDLNTEIKNLNLALLTDFSKAYGNFDIKKGHLGLFIEFAAKEGAFGGYVKPLLKDVEVVKGEGDLKEQIWEEIVSGAVEILENNQKDEVVGTKVEINGRFDQPDINLWKAVSYLLRNAFVRSLKPAIDQTINIGQLEEDDKKTLLEKVFGNKKKDKDNNNKRSDSK